MEGETSGIVELYTAAGTQDGSQKTIEEVNNSTYIDTVNHGYEALETQNCLQYHSLVLKGDVPGGAKPVKFSEDQYVVMS